MGVAAKRANARGRHAVRDTPAVLLLLLLCGAAEKVPMVSNNAAKNWFRLLRLRLEATRQGGLLCYGSREAWEGTPHGGD